MLSVRTLISPTGHLEVTAHKGSASEVAWTAQILTREAAAAGKTCPSTQVVAFAQNARRAAVITPHRPSAETALYQVNPVGVGRPGATTGGTPRAGRLFLGALERIDFLTGDAGK